MVSKETVRRVERRQSRIEAEPRRAVGTQNRVRLAHIDVDVRVVLRWGLADTHEFLHADADFRDAVVDHDSHPPPYPRWPDVRSSSGGCRAWQTGLFR